MRKPFGILVVLLSLVVGLPAQSSPVFDCIDTRDAQRPVGYSVRGMVKDLTMYIGGDVLTLTHCGSTQMVQANTTAQRPDIFDAERAVLWMVSDNKSQTFDEVAESLERMGFDAAHGGVPDHPCFCKVEPN